MTIEQLIAELNHLRTTYGNIEVVLEPTPNPPGTMLIQEPVSFAVAEQETPDKPYYCALRNWPY